MSGVRRRRRHSKKRKQIVVKLPEDILIEILFRLPVKSLLKFKTVCNSWNSIINNPQFVKKQLNHAHSTLYDQHKDFLGLLPIPDPSDDSTRCVLYNKNSNGIIYARDFDLPFELVEVCNYCDGLICFTLSNCDILVWNPSLPREYKIIPTEHNTKTVLRVGIGYDSTTDDYKIVRVPESRWNVDRSNSFIEVFSLKRKSWSKKKISKNLFTYKFFSKSWSTSIYTRNRLHWIGEHYDGGGEAIQSIIYFDMVEERLGLVNLPYSFARIFNYKDSLAVVGCSIMYWELLEEYNGMKSSWSEFELPRIQYLHIKGYRFSYPCFTRDGKILIQPLEDGRGHGLRTYDPEDGYVRNVENRDDDDDDIMYQKDSICEKFYASPYVESLVSPRWFE